MRPNWDEYFLGLAFIVSARSRDAETKHGCVIVDADNRIIGTGYNSFLRNIHDDTLPNTRPDKYPWMIHSEKNAILNCKVPPSQCSFATAYVTGQCCNDCLQTLIQAGIKRIVIADRHGSKLFTEESQRIYNTILDQTKIPLVVLKPDFQWIQDLLESVKP